MVVEIPWELEEQVWTTASRGAVCAICDGKKSVSIKGGVFDCPNCFGRGSTTPLRCTPVKAIIRSIKTENTSYHLNGKTIFSFYIEDETGKTNWQGHHCIFKTLAECEAFCRIANGETDPVVE